MRATRSDTSRFFVDTSAIVALFVDREEHHLQARQVLQELGTLGTVLLTTNLVAAETHAFVLSRAGRTTARTALRRVDAQFEILRVTEGDEQAGRAILDRYADKDFSLTDAISFAVMDRLKLRTAFAFDRHFAQYGLDVLTAE